MDERIILQASFAITIIGLILFALTYEPEFKQTTVAEIKKAGAKGIVVGRIDYVQKNYPITVFVLNDGNQAMFYYPKATTLEQNDFVEVYAENENPPNATKQQSIYVHKVVRQ